MMIHTGQADDGGRVLTLVNINCENFCAIPFEPEPGDDEKITSYIKPQSDQVKPYTGFSKVFLEEKERDVRNPLAA